LYEVLVTTGVQQLTESGVELVVEVTDLANAA
jgi:hypothetical protein